jgi:hypothetical protein
MAKAKEVPESDRNRQSVQEVNKGPGFFILREPFSLAVWSGSPFALINRFDDETERMKEGGGFNRYSPALTFGRGLGRSCGKHE